MDHLIIKYHKGEYLNVEQKLCIESSLLILQAENHLKRSNFWGKINGIKQDYFIVRGCCLEDYFKNVKYYYSNNLLDWTLVPKVRTSSRKPTQACSFHFTGIPSHVFEVTLPSNKNSEVWQLETVGLKEEDRLAATVEMINKEVNVIPRGAFHTLTDGTVLKNSVYKGMTEVLSLNLKSYIHFEDLRSVESFPYWNSKNSIHSDYPPGSWSIYPIDGGQAVALSSMVWPRLILYYQPNTPHYNIVYCGDGLKNLELYFMV